MMRRSVLPDDTRPIQDEEHVQLLKRDVMNDLVVGALQERRVDGDDGFESLRGQSGREGDRVGFGDPDGGIQTSESGQADRPPPARTQRARSGSILPGEPLYPESCRKGVCRGEPCEGVGRWRVIVDADGKKIEMLESAGCSLLNASTRKFLREASIPKGKRILTYRFAIRYERRSRSNGATDQRPK